MNKTCGVLLALFLAQASNPGGTSGTVADYKFNAQESIGSGGMFGPNNVPVCTGKLCSCLFTMSSTSGTSGGGRMVINFTNNETTQSETTFLVTTTGSPGQVGGFNLLLNSAPSTTLNWSADSLGAAGVYGVSVACFVVN